MVQRQSVVAKPEAPALGSPILSIRNLSARFTSHLGHLDALDDVTFDVMPGEFVCLIGPSGCGKSTLLRLVAGLLHPLRGEIALGGEIVQNAQGAERWAHRIGGESPRDREPARRRLRGSARSIGAPTRSVGLVFQQPTLLPWRTVAANVALPLELAGATRDAIGTRTAALLDLVGLGEFAQEYPKNLSGGMAQRVAIARALCQEPDVLLMDEPFGALDALTRERMAEELLRIWERTHRTVLLVTHNVEEAALLSDRVVVLSSRPGHVTDIIAVDLPRPREASMLMSQALQRLAGVLRAALFDGRYLGPSEVCD